jgi:hypothetical protein
LSIKNQTTTGMAYFNGPVTANAGTDPGYVYQNVYFGGGNTTSRVGAAGINTIASISTNYNSAFGYRALTTNTGGGFNSAFGAQALAALQGVNPMGSSNTAFGASSFQTLQTGIYNVGCGAYAADNMVGGTSNTLIGAQIGQSLLNTGDYNTFVGYAIDGQGTNNTVVGANSTSSTFSGSTVLGAGGGAQADNEASIWVNNGANSLRTPLTTIGSFTNGSGAALLAPSAFWIITLNGTTYHIPLFTP